MKIISAHAYIEKLPLTKPYTIAYKTITCAEIVFLEIILENGITGMGASSPSADVVGETPEDTLANLQSGFLQDMTGKDIRNFTQIIDDVSTLFPKLPGTQAAIDIALHDAFGKFLHVPVVDFYGRKINSLPTSITVGIKETEQMIEEANDYYKSGFRIFKIKTGINVEQDIERVHKLSENFGNAINIRVDANTGYNLNELKKFIHQTKELKLELIEQPLKVSDENQLCLLEADERKILAADESLLDAASAMVLAQNPQPYGIFNIKLMKCGGIKAAKEIATIAQHAGIKLFWGCNDESIVSITAAMHAAFSCANTCYLDLDGSFDIHKDIAEGGFTVKDGYMSLVDLPGLGIKKI